MSHDNRFLSFFAAFVLLVAAGCAARRSAPPPVELSIAEHSTGRPTVAADAERNAIYVAWTAEADSLENVYVARVESDSIASAPVRVNDRPGDAATHAQAPPQVAVGPDGTVYVVWLVQQEVPGRRFPASDLRLARSTDGGRSFEPVVTVNQDAGLPTGHHFHNLAVGPDGTVYVSWLDSSERDRATAALAASGKAGHMPVQSAMHQGHHSAARAEDSLPGTELRIASSTDGGRTFQEKTVAKGTCQCCRTALAVTPEGTLYVVWRHIFGENIRDIALVQSSDGGNTFSEPVRVHADGWALDGCPHAGPSIAVDGEGALHVIWYTGAEGGAGVFHAVSSDHGKSFGEATALAGNVPVAQVSAAPDAQGDIWLTWEDSQQNMVRLQQVLKGKSGDGVATMEFAGKLPSVATAGERQVLAWREGEVIRARIAAADL